MAQIVLVPGFDASALTHGSEQGHDCGEYFGGLIDTLVASGIPRHFISTVQTYPGDTNCDVDIGDYPENDSFRHAKHYGTDAYPGSHTPYPEQGHTLGTSWRHLGYHLAWYLATLHGPVRLIGHSGGGLIIRYALLQMAKGNPDFPVRFNINVPDVVTHGTPHRGVPMWMAGLCASVPWARYRQCLELRAGSSFIEELREGGDAAGLYGTEWTATGSNAAWPNYWLIPGCFHLHSDIVIAEDSAVGMPGANKIVWWPECHLELDPLVVAVDRSVTHAAFDLLSDSYVYYYDDGGVEADVPALVDGTMVYDYYHVDYATRRAVAERGR